MLFSPAFWLCLLLCTYFCTEIEINVKMIVLMRNLALFKKTLSSIKMVLTTRSLSSCFADYSSSQRCLFLVRLSNSLPWCSNLSFFWAFILLCGRWLSITTIFLRFLMRFCSWLPLPTWRFAFQISSLTTSSSTVWVGLLFTLSFLTSSLTFSWW